MSWYLTCSKLFYKMWLKLSMPNYGQVNLVPRLNLVAILEDQTAYRQRLGLQRGVAQLGGEHRQIGNGLWWPIMGTLGYWWRNFYFYCKVLELALLHHYKTLISVRNPAAQPSTTKHPWPMHINESWTL